MEIDQTIIGEYLAYLNNKEFPCVAARAAFARQHIKCMVAGNMACPRDDRSILKFLYDFVDAYRTSNEHFHSAAVIFQGPQLQGEEMFDSLLWQRLRSLSALDRENYNHDKRVDADPNSSHFSFSLKEEAFFIVGLHPASSRKARQFKYPTLAFNPHAEFEKLRRANRYEKLKDVVRKRDVVYSGSVNPMLKDFGEASEVYQYSGIQYDKKWQCPLTIDDAGIKDNPTA